jgi:uncharacterized protein (TIGR03435 family)
MYRNLPATLFVVALTTITTNGVVASGQNGQQRQPAVAGPAFEVASVKQNVSGSGQRGAGFQPGGRFRGSNMTLRGLIAAAYGTPQPLPLYRVVGGPGWLDSDRFDIDARATTDFADLPGQRAGWSPIGQQMLRRLLAERFRLVAHQETRDLPAYALTKAKSDGTLGSQLTVSRETCIPPPPPGAPPSDAIPCGGFRFTPPERVSARHLTMDEIARYIMLNAVDRPVVNRTDISGNFNMDLDFTRELTPPPPGAAPDSQPAFTGTSIFTAVQEQLGLKLEPTRTALEVVVIESVARPEPD